MSYVPSRALTVLSEQEEGNAQQISAPHTAEPAMAVSSSRWINDEPPTAHLVRGELALPDSENLLTCAIPRVPDETTARNLLRRRGMPKPAQPHELSVEDKLMALPRMWYAYNPPIEAIRFAQSVVATVRNSLLLRNPEHPRYARFYHAQAEVLSGKRLIARPSFLSALGGAGMLLAGPTGSGKSALLQRIRSLIGEEHTLLTSKQADAPAQMIFLPVLIVQWPDCGTLDGLLANIREQLIGELANASTNECVFANFKGSNGSNAAIATCILLNLGLLVVDGCRASSITKDWREISDFIASFSAYSGIPTILSCTYPFQQVVARKGGKGASVTSAATLGLEYLDPGSLWTSYCQFFWNLGLFGGETPLPEFLVSLMWKATRGNLKLAVEGFLGIHRELIQEPAKLQKGGFTEAVAAAMLAKILRFYSEAIKVQALFKMREETPVESREFIPQADLFTFGDYLPFTAFSNTPSNEFERLIKVEARRKRALNVAAK